MANRTPLYDWHLAHGARMVEFAGWDMPIQYSSIIEEHQAVRTGTGIFDISHMGRLTFEGPDALDLVQMVFTNNAATMEKGQVRYGLICGEKGGILDDVLVYRWRDGFGMVVNASNREKIVTWIGDHRGKLSVEMNDLTFLSGMLAVQGPRAAKIVRIVQNSECWRDFPPWDNLKYYHAESVGPDSEEEFDGAQDIDKIILSHGLTISRTGYTGEDGFELMTTSRLVHYLAENFLVSAREIGIEMKPCGLGARDTLRLEAGMPLYGHELSEEIDPFQAGLGWAVKMDKGDFIGREALLRRRQDKTLRQRVGLELEGKRIAREGTAVTLDGKEIGKVTSGTFSPTLAKPIAMAYLDPAYTKAGTLCQVDVRGKAAPARVVALPFYRRPKT